MLNYLADQTLPYPQPRRRNTSLGPVMVDGRQQEYVVQSGLPDADNQVSVYAFNIKRDIQGPSEMTTNRSLAIGEFGYSTLTEWLHVS